MQRGYSSVVVGLMFTLFTIPALLVRPVIGSITDKYKCRKTALISTIAMNCLALCALMVIPGTHVEKEIDDNDVIKSPLFWLFFSTIAIWNTSGNAGFVLENTICVALLGTRIIESLKFNFFEQSLSTSIIVNRFDPMTVFFFFYPLVEKR